MSLTSIVQSSTSRSDDRMGRQARWRRMPDQSGPDSVDILSAVPRIIPRPVMVAGQTGGAIAVLTLGRFGS